MAALWSVRIIGDEEFLALSYTRKLSELGGGIVCALGPTGIIPGRAGRFLADR